MSVLINMEMPESCSRCPMLEGDRLDGLCHAASRWLDDDEYWTWYVYLEGDIDVSKPCNCPLVPVPPHGRLIEEADAVETAWMILRGLGYLKEENPQLEQTVREVFATTPAIEVEEHG